MKPAPPFGAAILAIVTGMGCIDVGQLMSISGHDGGGGGQSLVIATFENGTATPDDPRFEPFQFYAYNPSLPDLPPGAFVNSPIVSPGPGSNYALGLNWEVIDVLDGQPNFPGAGVRTVVDGYVDLSAYTVFTFFQAYQHMGSCQPVPDLSVSFGCSQYNASVTASVSMASPGTTSTMALSSFAQSPYSDQPPVALGDCLKVVDGISFAAQVDLVDGDCASGELTLDNIELRRLPPSDAGADGPDAGDMGTAVGVSCPGCALLSVPLTATNTWTTFLIPIAPTDLTGATVTYRLCALTGTAVTVLQPFVQDAGPNYGGQFDEHPFTMISSCSEGLQDLPLTVSSTVTGFDPSQVVALGLEITSFDAGALADPTVVLVDSISVSPSVVGPWTFDTGAAPFSISSYMPVAGSTVGWVAPTTAVNAGSDGSP